jgi:threonine dehydratase
MAGDRPGVIIRRQQLDKPLALPSLAEIQQAASRVSRWATRTPLVRLNTDDAPAEIYLKLENLQPIGAFKIRGAGNAMDQIEPAQLARGVYTASAGNMAQGVAWHARRLGIACTAVVPDTAPEAKLSAITRLGADYLKVPFDEWWQVMVDRSHPAFADRLFVQPFADQAVMAGNGTIGLEIMEDLPDVDAVVVPFGGGGLAAGIAAAIKAPRDGGNAKVRVFASEVDTAAPFAASLAAGGPVSVNYTPTFVDGIGSKIVNADIWPLVSQILDGSLQVSVSDSADAIRLMLERNRVLAEGAAATAVAAATAGLAGTGRVVAVVSGGNIDLHKVATILAGSLP